jgi:molybdenum cofactor synthesis domain-containing protein
MSMQVGILTISDSRSQGARDDTATPLIRTRLEAAGYVVARAALVPDEREAIQTQLIDMADRLKLPLVVTTGGTGLGPRDVTPEATRAVIERDAPGLSEAMRAVTASQKSLAWLSRGVAGLRGRTLIVNLPGSPRAVEECLEVLLPLLPHALAMLAGAAHHGR